MCYGWALANLTILTPPDEIGFASASALLVLLEAAYADPIWVDFAAGCALYAECIVERLLLGVGW
jgi:hypothetical protein